METRFGSTEIREVTIPGTLSNPENLGKGNIH